MQRYIDESLGGNPGAFPAELVVRKKRRHLDEADVGGVEAAMERRRQRGLARLVSGGGEDDHGSSGSDEDVATAVVGVDDNEDSDDVRKLCDVHICWALSQRRVPSATA
jgi:hypothetical protein